MPSQDHHAGGRGEAGAETLASGCFWPKAAPHDPAAERPLLVKAATHNPGP
jgi:hypothetical protein